MSDADSDSSPADRDAQNPLRFQDALAEVEAITDRIERGEIGLEDSIEQFEKGMGLLKQCREILERTEQRVEDITQRLRESDARPQNDSQTSDDQDTTR